MLSCKRIVQVLLGTLLSVAHAEDLEIRICAGPKGSTYHAAAQIFQLEMQKLEGVKVRIYSGSGSLENALRLKVPNSGCDMGFVRMDTRFFLSTKQNFMSQEHRVLVPIGDNSGRTNDTSIASDELFHEYAQLICNREMTISKEAEVNGDQERVYTIGDIIDQAKAQKETWANNQEALGDLMGKIAQANRKGDMPALDTYALEQNEIESNQAALLNNKVTLFFVDEGVQKLIQGQDGLQYMNIGQPSVIWKNFVDQDDKKWISNNQYGLIETQAATTSDAVGMNGKTPAEVAFAHVLANKNACFLNVDRIANDGAMAVANSSYYQSLRLIELNDTAFNNFKIGSNQVYKFVQLADDIYPNLRARRPDWYILKGKRKIDTLAVKTQLMSTPEFQRQLAANPVLKMQIATAVKSIKDKMKDNARH